MNFFWTGLGAAIGLFLGMILHEYAHARVAVWLGDKTPKLHGRLTLNPKAHADPVGTIILPAIFVIPLMVGRPLGFLFGYAKPVPYNPNAMRDRRWSPLAVALAGPAVNFGLAFAAGAGLRAQLSSGSVNIAVDLLIGILTVNVFLGIINILPIPPLDGSKVLRLFLSPQAAWRLEELSQYLLLFLVVLFLLFRGVLTAIADPVCRAASFQTLPFGCAL